MKVYYFKEITEELLETLEMIERCELCTFLTPNNCKYFCIILIPNKSKSPYENRRNFICAKNIMFNLCREENDNLIRITKKIEPKYHY